MRRSKLLRGFLLSSASVFSLALTACASTGGAMAVKETVCNQKAKIIAAAQATIAATERLCPFDLDAETETESETDAINP